MVCFIQFPHTCTRARMAQTTPDPLQPFSPESDLSKTDILLLMTIGVIGQNVPGGKPVSLRKSLGRDAYPVFPHNFNLLNILSQLTSYQSYTQQRLHLSIILPLMWSGSLLAIQSATFGNTLRDLDLKTCTHTHNTISKKYFEPPVSPEHFQSSSLEHLAPYFTEGVEINIRDVLWSGVYGYSPESAAELRHPHLIYHHPEVMNQEKIIQSPEWKERKRRMRKDFSFDFPAISEVRFKDVKSTFPFVCDLKANFIHARGKNFYQQGITSIPKNGSSAEPNLYKNLSPTHTSIWAPLLNPAWIEMVEICKMNVHELYARKNEKRTADVIYTLIGGNTPLDFVHAPLCGLLVVNNSTSPEKPFTVIPANHWLHWFFTFMRGMILGGNSPTWLNSFLQSLESTGESFSLEKFRFLHIPRESVKMEEPGGIDGLKDAERVNEYLEHILRDSVQAHFQDLIVDVYTTEPEQISHLLLAFLHYAKSYYVDNKHVPLEDVGFSLFRMSDTYHDASFSAKHPWLTEGEMLGKFSGEKTWEEFLSRERSLQITVELDCAVYLTQNNTSLVNGTVFAIPNDFYKHTS